MSRISKWRCDLKLLDCFLVRSILAAGSFFGGFVRFLQDSSGFFQTAGGRLDCGGILERRKTIRTSFRILQGFSKMVGVDPFELFQDFQDRTKNLTRFDPGFFRVLQDRSGLF